MNKLLPVAFAAALLTFTNAHAQIFGGDDEARRQVIELRQEMTGRIEAISRGQFEMSNQNELLRGEITKLRGQMEVLVHEVDTLKQRQRDFYVDLDNRLRQIEQPGGTATAPTGDPAAESASYEGALNLLKGGKHGEALAAFKQFLTQYPRSTLLPGATFWAGNAALQAKEIAAAKNFFSTVIASWPDNSLASDAMLGLANSQQLLGDARSSTDTLKQLIARYPGSSAAQVASQRLGAKQ
ncbi:MAG: tol-pal system protein YbgF [Rhodocyclales bacterium]|nr:tol-pal system protein YbgF [Rhodocyclales bacterium]